MNMLWLPRDKERQVALPKISSLFKGLGGGSALQIIVLVASSLVAAAAGGGLGFMLADVAPPGAPAEDAGHAAVAEPPAPVMGKTASGHPFQLKELPAVVTNLGEPESKWVRLQGSIVFDGEGVNAETLANSVGEDIAAYLRTVALSTIEGADGLRRLHEDLSERAAIRSQGRVREFIIQTLVVQ